MTDQCKDTARPVNRAPAAAERLLRSELPGLPCNAAAAKAEVDPRADAGPHRAFAEVSPPRASRLAGRLARKQKQSLDHENRESGCTSCFPAGWSLGTQAAARARPLSLRDGRSHAMIPGRATEGVPCTQSRCRINPPRPGGSCRSSSENKHAAATKIITATHIHVLRPQSPAVSAKFRVSL